MDGMTDTAQQQLRAQPRLTRPDGSPIRVVVVDDEQSLADLVAMGLKYEGWDVKTAANGQQALQAVREFRPDAVVLDIMLPDIDGLEVLRRMREHVPDVPVLFLTAKDAVEDRAAGIAAGANDYLVKPYSLLDLDWRLNDLMPGRLLSRT